MNGAVQRNYNKFHFYSESSRLEKRLVFSRCFYSFPVDLHRPLISLDCRITSAGHKYSGRNIMLGLHGDILDIRVENIPDIIANCLCVNRVDSSVAGIL
jgi:hypothetical protein